MLPCPAPDTCWFYLIRHGATEFNELRPPRLQGRRIDAALSETGRIQAARTAQLLAHVPLQGVYCSPLLRARQTAEAIAESHGLHVEVIDALTEVDVGAWEGRTWEEVERSDPAAYRLFLSGAPNPCYLEGESLGDVQARVVPAMERLMAANLGRCIAAVTHNVVNRCYLAQLLSVPLSAYRLIPQDNCNVNVLQYRNGSTRAVTINSVWHLNSPPS
jgi:broad specificity phosphatase PhoE